MGQSKSWISRGFEELVAQPQPQFDTLVIGSGYGGAMAAHVLSQHEGSVAVLERGNEYLPGAFPHDIGELPEHLRYTDNDETRLAEGLYDIRAGDGVIGVVANGLGGGSLINAGVMLEANDEVFAEGWPEGFSIDDASYEAVEALLGQSVGGNPCTYQAYASETGPEKYLRLQALDDNARPAELTIATDINESGDSIESSAGVALDACIGCGDCATGCNHNAKNSLDVSLLAQAWRRNTEIFVGGTVLHLEQDGDLWVVHAVYTNEAIRERVDTVYQIRTGRVVLAAGTYGSTEILLRSDSLAFSPMLGRKASTNGDTIIANYDQEDAVNAVADEKTQPSLRNIGPTITGLIDRRDDGHMIQEMAVPAGLRDVFSLIYATANTFYKLTECDKEKHEKGFPQGDIYATTDTHMEHTALYALMGEDQGKGLIQLAGEPGPYRDGIAMINDPGAKDFPLFSEQFKLMGKLAETSKGTVIANPGWQPYPQEMGRLFNERRGTVLTVHPLGGCPMGDDAMNGVVDQFGRVFEHGGDDPFANLVVLDGSIIPKPLGANPALTIATVAYQALQHLVTNVWQLNVRPDDAPERNLEVREPLRNMDDEELYEIEHPTTGIGISERIYGVVRFRANNEFWCRKRMVELTLDFSSKDLRQLTNLEREAEQENPPFQLDVKSGQIRIFDPTEWKTVNDEEQDRLLDDALDDHTKMSAKLGGHLIIFRREQSWKWWRILRSSGAWMYNVGFRTLMRAVLRWLANPSFSFGTGGLQAGWNNVGAFLRNASRAGEVRKLIYKLDVDPDSVVGDMQLRSLHIRGEKTFKYGLKSNPWRQLLFLEMKKFPGRAPFTRLRWLRLDSRYLARIAVPLIRFYQQRDQVRALADLLGFLGYVARLTLGIHLWNFRKPDEWDEPQVPNRLPGDLQGDLEAHVVDVPMPNTAELDGDPVVENLHFRLTRYSPEVLDADAHPVLMIHGYSASGTTFAHAAVQPNATSHFVELGREVWVLDLRTSAGMETAKLPWTFEDAALNDIPEAVQRVLDLSATGKDRVDVVAHCMGAAMFSMAVLGRQDDARYPQTQEREDLPEKINRAVFTQVTPTVIMTPDNILRSFIVGYVGDLVGYGDYSFFPPANPSLVDQLFDRILSTLPYPREEYRLEYPLSPFRETSFTQTRHRMDALYGEAFSLAKMDSGVLKHINDLFGPLNLQTVSQTIDFARYNLITDGQGRNEYVSRQKIKSRWKFPTCVIQATNNGLSDYRGMQRFDRIFDDAGIEVTTETVPGAGHQDCLIGDDRNIVFDHMSNFLVSNEAVDGEGTKEVNIKLAALTPWLGPIIAFEPASSFFSYSVRYGSQPQLSEPLHHVYLRAKLEGGEVVLPNGVAPANAQPDDVEDYLTKLNPQPPHEQGRWYKRGMLDNDIPELQDNEFLILFLLYDEAKMAARRTVGSVEHSLEYNDRVPRITAFNNEGELARYPMNAFFEGSIPFPFSLFTENGLQQFGSEADLPNLPFNTSDLDDLDETQMDYEEASKGIIRFFNEQRYDGTGQIHPPKVVNVDSTYFAFGSCQYTIGILDEQPAMASYDSLDRRFIDQDDDHEPPNFAILCGDQVYADANLGLINRRDKASAYRKPYERLFYERSIKRVLGRLPTFMLLDDHEIKNNWEPIARAKPDHDEVREMGYKAYQRYQEGFTPSNDWIVDGFPFYFFDTRSKRQNRNEISDNAEFTALIDWLVAQQNEQQDKPKFVVTSSILIPRRARTAQSASAHTYSDAWDGYPASIHAVFESIWSNSIENVVFLSGDEHRAVIAQAQRSNFEEPKVYSVHTRPLYAPYPFAKARRDRFDAESDIMLGGEEVNVTIRDDYDDPPDGFTFVRVGQQNGNWQVEVEFDEQKVSLLP